MACHGKFLNPLSSSYSSLWGRLNFRPMSYRETSAAPIILLTLVTIPLCQSLLCITLTTWSSCMFVKSFLLVVILTCNLLCNFSKIFSLFRSCTQKSNGDSTHTTLTSWCPEHNIEWCWWIRFPFSIRRDNVVEKIFLPMFYWGSNSVIIFIAVIFIIIIATIRIIIIISIIIIIIITNTSLKSTINNLCISL